MGFVWWPEVQDPTAVHKMETVLKIHVERGHDRKVKKKMEGQK